MFHDNTTKLSFSVQIINMVQPNWKTRFVSLIVKADTVMDSSQCPARTVHCTCGLFLAKKQTNYFLSRG